MRASNFLRLSILNAHWIPLNFQTTALMTIAVPAAILRFPGIDKVAMLALLATIVATISMIVPPVAGEISDRFRRRGASRSWVVICGAFVNAGALLWMIQAPTPGMFVAAIVLATLGQNVSQTAYSALIPEAVPREFWGAASGHQGVGTLIGSIAGLVVAGAFSVDVTLLAAAALIFAGSFTVLAIDDTKFVDVGHAQVRDLSNFAIAFASRFFTLFGLTLLNTFILYFFEDVLKVTNPPAGTAFVGVATMIGAIVTSIVFGIFSDRIPRKVAVAIAGVPMALAAIGFAVLPEMRWILVFAVFFGLGYGAFLSAGWALGLDSVPELGNVARYLGIWGIASNLPAVFAPEAGNFILKTYHAHLDGYPALFIASGLSFLIGSAIVLATRKR
jgi:MFS family permease